jgi:hypothetical protein
MRGGIENGFLCVEKRGEENINAFWFEDLYYRKANRRLYNANFRTKIHVPSILYTKKTHFSSSRSRLGLFISQITYFKILNFE